jgi:hypothetical protein
VNHPNEGKDESSGDFCGPAGFRGAVGASASHQRQLQLWLVCEIGFKTGWAVGTGAGRETGICGPAAGKVNVAGLVPM